MIHHQSPISGIATFKDRYIATAGYDNQVILWDPKTRTAIAVGRHDHLGNQCEFSPCGQYLISTSSDYTVRLWQVPSMQLLAVLGPHQDDVEMAIFHPRERWIATASRDKTIRLFDFQGHLIRGFVGHEKDVISLAFLSKDLLLSSSDDGTIRHWDIHTGQQILTIDLGGVETDTIAIHPEGIVFAGNDEGDIALISDKHTIWVKAHQSGIKRLCYSTTHKMLVSLSYDRSMRLWRLNEAQELVQINQTILPPCVWARSCAFLGENQLVLATFGSHYAVYDYKEEQWITEQVQDTHGVNAVLLKEGDLYQVGDSGVVCINGSRHSKLPSLCNFLLSLGHTVICGGQTGEVYDALKGEILYQHHSPLNCGARYTESGKEYALIGSYTGEGLVFEVDSNGNSHFVDTVALHQNAIKGIAVEDGLIFSVCADYAAAFHETKTFQLKHYLRNAHDKIANACSSFGNGLFVSASRDLKLRLFSADEVKEFKTEHRYSIKCLATSKDKQWLASADYRGHVFVYDRDFNTIAHQRPTLSGISQIIAGKRNYEFLAASYDGTVYPMCFKEIDSPLLFV